MSLQDDYRAIRERAVVGAVAPRGQLAVAGRERASYLQGLLTNDIVALVPGSGCYAAWLSPQGRMLTDMHVLQSDSMILLDLPLDQTAPTLQRLDQFLFGEDVQLASLVDSLASMWVHGPRAAQVLEQVLGPPDGPAEPATRTFDNWREYQHAHLSFDSTPVVMARISQLGVPGFCVYIDRARESDFAAALAAAGAARVGPDAIEASRIEAGYPVYGVDMTDDTIPLEAGIEDRAISRTKGCYVGQEVIVRVLDRGHGRVARRLVVLRVEGSVPDRGDRLFADERDIGFVTSAASSPAGGAVALAYVHRDFAEPGTSADVAAAAGRVPATVTARQPVA